jgi:NADP-dependent alcohol dehydrogenase
MNGFTYCNPVKIVFGKESIERLDGLVPAGANAMLVYGGGSIKKNGVYDRVKKAMGRRKLVEFAGIEPNPTYETCMKAAEKVRSEGLDFLLAAGGGSVLDATKFIAAAVPYEGDDPWRILETRGEVVKSALPLGTVLTLPATGSEMNRFAVISRKKTQQKCAFPSDHVYPRFSIMDPQVTYSLPKKYLRNGIVDAFVHVMEQYATADAKTPLQDRQAEAIALTLLETAGGVLSGRNDYDTMATFMWCATMALNGLISCGCVQDWSTHMIGHELTAFFGIDHAESLAAVLPGVWRLRIDSKKAKLAKLAERVWAVTAGTENERAEAAIMKTEEFFESVGMPTRLGSYGIGAGDIKKVVDRFTQSGTALGENADIDAAAVGDILQSRL